MGVELWRTVQYSPTTGIYGIWNCEKFIIPTYLASIALTALTTALTPIFFLAKYDCTFSLRDRHTFLRIDRTKWILI